MPSGTDQRTCESCGGAMPKRTHRQRNDKGQLVCDSCKENNMPSWSTTHAALSVLDQSEMARREAEALTSIVRIRQAKHAGLSVVAHDSGDNAVIHHCPFCGSGAVVGGSDGTASCEFCHSSFTVQVQPNHPYLPQTIDGEPVTPPGMPGGEETELSSPIDPTIAEEEDGVMGDPLGDADPESNGPVAPGQPPRKQPPPPSKADPKNTSGKPPWLKNKASRTAAASAHEGHDLVDVSMSWGARLECDTCRKTVEITGEEGNVVWTEGDPLADLKHVLRGRSCYEFPGPKPEQDFGQSMRYWEKKAIQTRDPNSREEHPYPDMDDYVVIADAIRRFIRAGLFSTYEEAKRSGVVDRLKVDGIQSNLTTEDKVQEILSEHTGKQAYRTATGATLDEKAYMAHLALAMADDRDVVLDAVRLGHSQRG